MITRSFEEIEVGEVTVGRGRTITETDVVNFCSFTGNWLEIHSNTEVAKRTEYGQRLVQGSLTFALIPGLVGWDPRYIVAFYGVDQLRFRRPVFIGDTVHPELVVVEKTVKDERRGVIGLAVEVKNQRQEVVQSSIMRMLVRRHGLDLDGSTSGHTDGVAPALGTEG